MKAILLLRHADSGDKLQGQTDHERVLTNKGIQQATAVAGFLKEKDLRVDLVVASDATRVKSTLEIIFKQVGTTPGVHYLPELYDADAAGYLDAIHKAPDCQALLIAGHNPSITTFASFISMTRVTGVGTGNLLVFHFKDDSWAKLNKGQCELMEHFVP